MPPEPPLRFEDAMQRLDALVLQLEEGDTDLDGAVAAYEEGVRLARTCLERLEAAETRIHQLQLSGDEDDV